MTSFYEFQRRFPDDEACLAHMMTVRYGGLETACPKCGNHGKFYRMRATRAYVCQHCAHHVHPTAGTFMHRTRIALHKWFFAIYLFSTSRHGVAAKELERQLDVSYPTAWRMAHLIRQHMAETDGDWPLAGVVEADETYVGGRRRGGPSRAAEPTRQSCSGWWSAAGIWSRGSCRTSASRRYCR